MKKLYSIAGFLLLLLTTGCSTVVYRVNPDSPPQMNISDARDAIELSMSVIRPNMNISSFVVTDDEMLINRTLAVGAAQGHAALLSNNKVSYGDISREVIKAGENYSIYFYMRNALSSEYISITWKSKEDAIQFANAAYVLQNKGNYEKLLIKKPVAPSHTGPFKQTVQDKGIKELSKDELLDFSPKKGTNVVLDQSLKAQPPIKAHDEKTPPKIFITSPDVTRAVSVVAKRSTITVTGRAESSNGIADVLVNGQQADIDEKGHFSTDILLKVGENPIIVKAIDIRNNEATRHFIINRQSGKIVAAKPEAMEPSRGLRSAKYYALFIAVQDYASPEINKLDYPVSDATQLMETLISKYTFEKEDVLILQNPDRKSIYKAFQDLRRRLTEKDNLLVFYAGHGTWVDDMKQGFWLPRDAAGPNDPSDWIPNSNVRDYIKSIKAKHVLLVADACFSGGIFKVRTAFADPSTSMEKIYELPSRKAITSGSLKSVPDRSVFVDFLIKRLRDNREPYLDTQKLFANLREAVINNSVTNQTPLYGAINEAGDEGGDFVFVRR